MIYKGYDVKVSKHKIIWEIDNKRYNIKDYAHFNIELIQDRVYGIFTELQSMNDTELKDYIDESLIEEAAKTDKPLIKEVNKKEREYEVMLPSHNDVIANKSYPYKTYSNLMLNSNFNPKKKDGNYIYKKDIKEKLANFMEEAKKEFPDGKLPAPRQIEKHIKTMLECDIPLLKVENSPQGVIYKLTPKVDNKYYVRIPYPQVRELVLSTNDNMLKLYVVLRYKCNDKSFTTLDRKYFARKLGLSDKADKNLKKVGAMLTSLANLGFIEIKQEVRTDWDEKANREVGKKINSYRLTTLEEYKEAKKRGFINK